jgi:hypothetical protein
MARDRGPRGCHWCFTSYRDRVPDFDLKIVRYGIYQKEICPETKRSHWQGYIEFYDRKRVAGVRKVVGEGVHCELRRGSRTAARDYCRKLEGRVEFTCVEYGEWRVEVNRKRKLCDILKSDMTMDDIVDQVPHVYVRYHKGLEKLFNYRASRQAKIRRRVSVKVYVGPTGTGKTTLATSGEDWYCMPVSKDLWFDGYRGEKCLVIDDFEGGIKYSFLLRILHGHCMQGPVKGSFCWARWTKVIITSNKEVEDWYPNRVNIRALLRRCNDIVHTRYDEDYVSDLDLSDVDSD